MGSRPVARVAHLDRPAGDNARGTGAAGGCAGRRGARAFASAPRDSRRRAWCDRRRRDDAAAAATAGAILSRRRRRVGREPRVALLLYPHRLSRRGRAGARVHLRRRHLSGEPLATVRSAARRAHVDAVPPSPNAECRPVRGVPGFSRRRGAQRITGALSSRRRRRPRGDAPHQGHAAARGRPRARLRARRRARP